MRLTTVAQMSLPSGRLRSLRVRVAGERGRELPVSFDQGRHVGGGDRPGSWMALAFRLPGAPSERAVEEAWLGVVGRHGTLRTAFDRAADGVLRLHEIDVESTGWSEHPIPDGTDPRSALRALLDGECRPFATPSSLLCLVDPAPGDADARTVCVIASDHSHVDMWSLAVLGRDLLSRLGDETAGLMDPEESIPAFADHTAALEAMPPAPESVRDDWAALLATTGGLMPAFPLPLGRLTAPLEAVVEIRDVLGPEELQRFEATARERGVRAIALATSALASATRRLSGAPLRAVFPVHSRFEERWRHSVGWFITNSILECEDSDPMSCAADVTRAITLGGYPLAPILEPYGGMVEPPGMFAISWLDVRRLPVALPDGLEAQYVSAVISTDAVMIWFIVNAAGLHLRCRYPDTPEARGSLAAWLDALEADLRGFACES
jgi:mycolipenoyl-CoA---2-(long-chain-fatty acyl)-trehalose mycolipenoyltransferase / long-chain-acyl-CoA---trehalose acyltransferase